MKKDFIFTSESVSEGHPDKICDQISDSILDTYLSLDRNAKAGIEVLATTNRIVIAGEVRTTNGLYLSSENIDEIVRNVVKKIGYEQSGFDWRTVRIENHIHSQSADIAMGVDVGRDEENEGAGDQGLMFGYACNETEDYMPSAIYYSHKILRTISEAIKNGELKDLGPDAKSQVSVEYKDGKPIRATKVVVSIQHRENLDVLDVRKLIIPYIEKSLPNGWMPEDKDILINPTGRFVIGGPDGDTGLTGRKIIVDTYGGYAPHGGGAFCVDGDTEYLTRNGWKKISQYNEIDEVAQWDDGNLEFVKPIAYHVCKAENMYHIYNHNSLDMVLSEHHNIVLKTSKGNIIKKLVKDVLNNERTKLANGNNGYIPCSFNYRGNEKGIKLTDDQIKLQVAFCADGTILKNHCGRIRVKKQYKKDRLEELLKKSNTTYKFSQHKDGYYVFTFKPPFLSKRLSKSLLDLNYHQMKIVAEELVRWDGNNENVFRTTIKEEADYAQFIFMSVYGTNASIKIDNRVGKIFNKEKSYIRKSVLYEVTSLKYKDVSFRHSNLPINKMHFNVDKFIPNDNTMYCFTVPSSILVLRRNNKVFITGNSGKDPSKVDRSAAYMARYLAKNVVASGLADKCLIQLSYAIGVAKPLSFYINCQGTAKVDEKLIEDKLLELVDLRPSAIIKRLDLKQPIYKKTAAYGHFGRKPEADGSFSWEKLDLVDELKKLL